VTEPVSASLPSVDQTDRPIVLIVDDRPENLLALEAVIESLDITVVRADSGEDALRRLLTDDVAVIILDVQMPGLDGFETAAHIKGREKTRNIPIIFLTAISTELDHALRGYDVGAVDYVSKPFNPEVLRAKVSVFVDLHRSRLLIEQQAEQLALRLEQRERDRAAIARQAVELERSNAEFERFATAVATDLAQPMYRVAGFLDLLHEQHSAELSAEAKDMVERADAAAQQLFERVEDLLRYARATHDTGGHVAVDLGDAFADAADALAPVLLERDVSLSADPLPTVRGDAHQLSRLFVHLVAHAAAQEEVTQVHIGVSREGREWVLAVRDDGAGLDADQLTTLFSLGASSPDAERADASSAALDLPIARRIVEHHGGTIRAQSVVGRGTTISCCLPAAEEPA